VKDSFADFYEMLKLDRKNSAWSKDCSLKSRVKEFAGEAQEIVEAVEKLDDENLKEELGDALWDLLFLFVLAEEKKLFTAKDVIEGAIAKLHRRKPWIFDGEKVSKEEELRRWAETKKQEKRQKLQNDLEH
jgi:uncharacterized protein YabN with tetrapyrrole methylase and pyrophosphatase domain